MSNVSVEYLVLRDNVEFSRLTAFKGGGAAISVTADAAVKWALSGKFAQNSDVNYLTDVIQPVLTIDGVRRPLGKYIPTDAYTEHDGMRPVVSLTAYDLTYLAMSSKIETRLHLAKGTLYTAAIQALLVESGIMDFFVEANTATLQAERQAAYEDEARAQAGHPPFRHVGEAPVERIRHHHSQHGVAQKLQPLVALAAGGAALVGKGAVRQRGLEKRPVAEMVAELFLKGFHQLPEACST